MALLWMESFDKYDTAAEFYEAGYVFGAQTPTFVAGRHDNCLDLGSFSAFTSSPTFSPTDNEGWIGFAFRSEGGLTNDQFMVIREGSTQHLNLFCNGNGTISVRRGTTVLGTSTTAIVQDSWIYIEFHFVIHNTTGEYGLRFNGASSDEISGTSQDTQNGGTAAWDNFAFDGDASSSVDEQYDDLYLLDSASSGVTGALNNDYLGDMIVECLQPSGNGNTSQLTGSDGNSVDNYLHVDETPGHDTDTSYNESNVVSNQDTYAMDNLVFIDNDDIKAVQVVGVMRKVDAGARSGRNIIRHSAVDYYGATLVLGTSYVYHIDIAEGANPFSGTTQWTIANVDAFEAGFDVVA